MDEDQDDLSKDAGPHLIVLLLVLVLGLEGRWLNPDDRAWLRAARIPENASGCSDERGGLAADFEAEDVDEDQDDWLDQRERVSELTSLQRWIEPINHLRKHRHDSLQHVLAFHDPGFLA